MHRRHAIGATVALAALLVAACGSSSTTPSPSPVPTTSIAGATATPSASAAASSTESSASPATSFALPSGALPSLAVPSFNMHGDPALEAKLPSSLAGKPLQKVSFSMGELAALGAGSSSDQTFFGWLKALGKSPNDANIAVASDEAGGGTSIGAIQVNGTDPGQLLSTFLAASASQKMTTSQVTLGGKQVGKVVDPSNGQATYVYPKDDILYFVDAPDDNSAATGIQALP